MGKFPNLFYFYEQIVNMYEINLEKEKAEITRRYKEMLKNSYQELSVEDKKMIRKALDIAVDGHKDQRRKSGEPYIYHPLEVAKIVADEIGLGAVSIACALLHDVVEDTHYTLEDIEKLFDARIAKIINGLTKISIINDQDISIQSENYRKLLLTLSEDFRVILIKIADRLHNMRTLDSMKPEKQLKIASETIYIYSPLAHRMGLYNIKSELEDLSLKYTDAEMYHYIEKSLEETKEERERYIEEFTEITSKRLQSERIKFSIKGRPKSINSIYRKIKKQGVSFEEIYDKFAIRIIYKSDVKNEKFLAWKIYSIVTDEFTPNPSRLRDWITQPRSTGYESLHTTVIGPEGKWVEVQIRSERMDELAEKGIAAHYKYKEGFKVEDNQIENWIGQVRELLENQENTNTKDLLDSFKLDLYHKEIFIFTPKGELKVLPNGATSLDFAYSVHSNIGDRCLGAKVNNRLVPLSHKLQSGDQVEIITSVNQKPKPDWLEFVTTSRAKSKIKNALNNEKRKISEDGKEILFRKLRHLKINPTENEINNLQKHFSLQTSQDLFYNIAIGRIDNKELKKYAESKSVINTIINRFRRNTAPKIIQPKEELNYDSLVFGDDESKLNYTLSKCCNPIPGDSVFGFVSINQGIKVHKQDCSNAISMRANYDYRVLKAKWIDSSQKIFFANITIKGIDKMGLLSEITKMISENLHINISSFNISSNDGIFDGRIKLEVKNTTQLEILLKNLKKIEGITKVTRENK